MSTGGASDPPVVDYNAALKRHGFTYPDIPVTASCPGH